MGGVTSPAGRADTASPGSPASAQVARRRGQCSRSRSRTTGRVATQLRRGAANPASAAERFFFIGVFSPGRMPNCPGGRSSPQPGWHPGQEATGSPRRLQPVTGTPGAGTRAKAPDAQNVPGGDSHESAPIDRPAVHVVKARPDPSRRKGPVRRQRVAQARNTGSHTTGPNHWVITTQTIRAKPGAVQELRKSPEANGLTEPQVALPPTHRGRHRCYTRDDLVTDLPQPSGSRPGEVGGRDRRPKAPSHAAALFPAGTKGYPRQELSVISNWVLRVCA